MAGLVSVVKSGCREVWIASGGNSTMHSIFFFVLDSTLCSVATTSHKGVKDSRQSTLHSKKPCVQAADSRESWLGGTWATQRNPHSEKKTRTLLQTLGGIPLHQQYHRRRKSADRAPLLPPLHCRGNSRFVSELSLHALRTLSFVLKCCELLLESL